MANEAILVTRTDHPISFACADNDSIEKGAFVKMSGNNTVANWTGALAQAGGFAAAEKVAGDGVTQIAIYRKGRFKVFISGLAAVSVGDPLIITSAPNMFASGLANANLSGMRIVGSALEACAATGESCLMELNITSLGVV